MSGFVGPCICFTSPYFIQTTTTFASACCTASFICRLQGMYDQAVCLFERVLTISEGTAGLNHPQTVETRGNVLDLSTKIMDQAETLHRQVLKLGRP